MKHLCMPGEQPARLPCPPPFILLLLPEPGWVSPAHGSRGDTATPRCPSGWVLPSQPPSAFPEHEAPLLSTPEAGGTCPPGVSEHRVCPVIPPPPRDGLPAAKCPLSIRRQARDYRGRLFEAETNRKSFSQLPFGDINTGRGSAGRERRARRGGGFWDEKQTPAHTDTHPLPGQRGARGGTRFPGARGGNPARKGRECECECECECPALGRG